MYLVFTEKCCVAFCVKFGENILNEQGELKFFFQG